MLEKEKEKYAVLSEPYEYKSGGRTILVTSFYNTQAKATAEELIIKMLENRILNERNKKLSETFKINLDKEVLLNVFKSNYEREAIGATQTLSSAENDLGGNRTDRQQLQQYDTGRNIPDGQQLKSDGYEGDNFEAAFNCLRNAISESESKVRADESRRKNRSLDEKSRQSQRERSQSEKGNSRKKTKQRTRVIICK